MRSGTTTDVFTHFNTDFQWKEIVSAPNGIYVWGQTGIKSEVYLVRVGETGSLATPFLGHGTA